MVQITYVDHLGAARAVDVPEGSSVMQGAVANGVPGIDAICGGCCSCGTCHVHVDEAWRERVGPPSPAEQDLLDFTEGAGPGSRLACQIAVTSALDGLVVRTPESQG